jgi:hypothetical protein
MTMGTSAADVETWPAIVRYDGVFDWDGLYKGLVEYLRRNNYWFYEKLYKSKPWSPIGTELVLKWEADRKLNEYYLYRLKFEWHFMDFHHVDVIRDGKKVTLTKSYFYVDIRGVVIQDWQGLEKGHGGHEPSTITKFLGKFVRNHVIDREFVYDYIYPLYDEVMEVQKFIQEYIHFESTRTSKYTEKTALV